MPLPLGGAKPAADVARILDQASIDYLLWGWKALAVLANDKGYPEVDFLIPDTQMNSAVDRLNASGSFGRACTRADCPELSEDRLPANHLSHWKDLPQEHRLLTAHQLTDIQAEDRFHPVAHAHFHIDALYPGYSVLALHKQSYILWAWPDLDLGGPISGSNVMLLTNDPRLTQEHGRSGPWDGLYPIKTLTPWAYTEAILLLICRDSLHYMGLDNMWETMLAYLSRCDAEVRTRLSPQFIESWEGIMLRGPDSEGSMDALGRLRDRLISEQKLTDLPPQDAYRWL
ncbi:hypothetical protein BJY00DRAFT_315731 [Aspergillus carlsbadensis]|nr:hypothetical protein BJY00DRAFT_315731 [Aspergillus carlsbadensis]